MENTFPAWSFFNHSFINDDFPLKMSHPVRLKCKVWCGGTFAPAHLPWQCAVDDCPSRGGIVSAV